MHSLNQTDVRAIANNTQLVRWSSMDI